MRTRTKLIIVGLCILLSGETDARRIRLTEKYIDPSKELATYATDPDLILCEDALTLTQYKLDSARKRIKYLEAENATLNAALKTTQSKLDSYRVANEALRADCARKGKR